MFKSGRSNDGVGVGVDHYEDDDVDECSIVKNQAIAYSQVSSLHGVRFIGEPGRPWYER